MKADCLYCNSYGEHNCRSPYGYGESRPVGLTDRRLTIEVACPKCGARPGKPCATPSGVVRPDYPHLARKKLRVRVAAYDVSRQASGPRASGTTERIWEALR